MSEAMTFLIVSAIGTAIVQLVTFATIVFNSWTQRRERIQARKWELEDRARLAQDITNQNLTLSLQNHEIKAALKENTIEIKENTKETLKGAAAALEAQREANHANLKIENTNKHLIVLSETLIKQQDEITTKVDK